MSSDTRPGFAFQYGVHDRLSERRDDVDFLASAWEDDASRVVLVRELELATDEDGRRLATVPPSQAPEGQRMLLGSADGVVYFLVVAAAASEGGAGDPQRAAPPPPDAVDPAGHPTYRSLRSVATDLDELDASLAVHAVALAQWHDRHGRCAVCGSETAVAMAGASRRCLECGAQHFPRTDPAVIMLVVDDEDRCLLGHHAARDVTWYSTLAGFVEPGEALEDAVVREVAEETAVVVDAVEYFGSQPWPFPSSLMLGFRAHASGTAVTVDGVEITRARWFTREQLRREIEAGELVVPSTVSISGALIQSWYGAELPAAGLPAAGLPAAGLPASGQRT